MKKGAPANRAAENKMMLQLFVSGMSFNSMTAIENLKRLCNAYMKGAYELEIIDIYKNPDLAREHSIVFCPSLVKLLPFPKKILIGTLDDDKKVIHALGINLN